MVRTWHSEEFWNNLERLVSTTVEQALREPKAQRAAVIEYLHNIEEMARLEPDREQTLQIIASGRSLLGERSSAKFHPGPFDTSVSRGDRSAPGMVV